MLVRSFARLSRFRADQRGNVAIIAGLVFMALIVIGGAAIDLHRAYTARTQGQDALDLAGVAAASSRHTDPATLEQVAREYLDANAEMDVLEDDPEIDVDIQTASRIDMSLRGSVRTFFMGLIGINSLPVNVSTAVERGAVDRVELALVLDNTFSMTGTDSTGTRRIDALKSAARSLVDALLTRQDGSVRIGVVPYADYVNVGLSNRNADWVYDTADYTEYRPTIVQHYRAAEPAKPRSCTIVSTRRVCRKSDTPKTCVDDVDGIKTSRDCTPNVCRDEPITPEERCTPAQPAKPEQKEIKENRPVDWKWYGCVGSRRQGNSRLHDEGSHKYPGLRSENGQNCVTEITPLTDRKATVTAALSAMITNIGTRYRPLTYIPTGVVWGVNMLSPTAPLTDAADYNDSGRDPRKIMVLMTDGSNYLKFQPSDGRHVGLNTKKQDAERAATDADTAAVCTYAKSKGIEIYTVALAVETEAARKLLEDCATSPAHYYDARDNASMSRAFADIAASIYRVRIVQ